MRHIQNQFAPPSSPGCQLPVDRVSPRASLHFVHEAGSLQSLAESICWEGLHRPVLVRRTGNGRYVIVSGNRRLMACRMLGWSHIGAYILADDVHLRSAEQLLEALRARRMHYLEEADAMRTLQERHGMARGEIARLTGRSPGQVTEQLRLCDCGEELRALLMDEAAPMGVALTLLRIPEHQARMRLAMRIVRERLCVRDAALLVTSALARMKHNDGVCKWDNAEVSQNNNRVILSAIRDQRLYVNAIRQIAGQMKKGGLDATVTEQRTGGRMEVTVSFPVRRRRAARYQSM